MHQTIETELLTIISCLGAGNFIFLKNLKPQITLFRCRIASNKQTPVATDTFKLLT